MPRSLPGPLIGAPPTEAWPVVGSSNPAMMRSKVDLPQPDAPITQTNWPSLIVTSMRASASTVPAPTGNCLVTPRISRCARVTSCMMLRTPLQDAVAERDDDAIAEKATNPNHDHAGHHKIGARERAAVHDHRAEPGGNAGHLAHHDEDPGKSMGDAKPVE